VGVKVRFHRGSWWLFIDHRGRRRAKKIGDRQAALEVAREVRRRLVAGELGLEPPEAVPTLTAYATQWLETGKPVWKPSTYRSYELNLRLHIVPAIGGMAVSEIRRKVCRDLIGHCVAKGLKLASLRGVSRTLSAVLSQAVEDELLPANPAFRMGRHLRLAEAPVAEIRPLTADEARLLLTTARTVCPAFYPLFLCALRTGMRMGQLLALEWVAVDLANRRIDVRQARVAGKLTTPKNRRRRTVDMSLQLTEELRRLRAERCAAALKAGKPDEISPLVFLSQAGHPVDGDNLRSRVFYRLLEKAGLRHVRFHDLRHTFASLLIQQNQSLAYVCEQMGHSSIQVTVDVYGHLVPGSNRAAVDALDDPIRDPGATGDDPAAQSA
jgi:integrase